MTKPTVRVSASQIQLASLCWRKWAFAYIRGLREPETRALALGTKVHAILEAYLRDGTVPDPNETWSFPGETRTFYPGKIALNMMPAGLFPAPGVGKVEHRFEWHNDGIIWNGLVDWHAFNPTAPPAEFEEMPGRADTGLIVVIDHKTSSDPVKWGKTEETLHNDPQAIVYARAMIGEYGPANVACHWNYGSTQGVASKSKVASTRYTPGDAYALFENKVAPIGREIRRLRLLEADPLSLDPNPDACGAYHKNCPHVETCNLTTAQRIGSVIMGNSLVDSLLAQASNQAAAPPPAAPPPPAEGDTVNPSEAHVPVGQGAPVKPTVPGILPTDDAPAPAPAVPAAPVVPVTGSGQAADPAAPKPAKPPKAPRKPRTPKAAAAAAPDNGLEAVLADLKKIREVDDELADLVAAKIADRIADKLLGEA